ncbi:uncharacterized protein LOC128730876 [Anopheles nili]|uniref:uncharacterized protein LOC128730876 n=1 Tax=Anopheles nili TaxID=185578 RepID=UPI00237AE786|nr:uncharacterized protein LOC128730876 [Anopheles nili]
MINRTNFLRLNNTKQYTFRITKYVCTGAPYKRSNLHYCKTILRRNQPTMINVSLTVPEEVYIGWVVVKLYYKFATYQPFLIDAVFEACEYLKNRPINPVVTYVKDIMQETAPSLMSLCPHGHTPRSVPAGEYRLDITFSLHDNVTAFAFETYIIARRKGIIGSMIEW